ncbi:unnamed protein product [Pleuronectes platessa]|uniref:Uncharacterized protein n=1 Tax=Pleuronectes platessa TaxID=8262 RepID=A0A9N7VLX3_PLEPL|nr:unnamed protein product [Pleuronectes platessa]
MGEDEIQQPRSINQTVNLRLRQNPAAPNPLKCLVPGSHLSVSRSSLRLRPKRVPWVQLRPPPCQEQRTGGGRSDGAQKYDDRAAKHREIEDVDVPAGRSHGTTMHRGSLMCYCRRPTVISEMWDNKRGLKATR